MRVLYHHRVKSKDGQFVHVSEIIAALRRAGCEVEVVGPLEEGESDFGADGGWAAALRRSMPGALYETLEFAYSAVAFRRLRDAARRFRPDVIYERYNLHFMAGHWLSRLTGIPLLLEVNSPLAMERAKFGGLALPGFAAWAERKVWRGADAVLPVTEVLAGHLRSAGVDPGRIHVIPNGVEAGRFAAVPADAEAKAALGLAGRTVLGFIGFVREWHRLDLVLDYMAARRNARLHLAVIGDGPARSDLQARAARLGLSERVTFTGVVPPREVPRWVSAYDVALQPNVVDYACPLKILDYMAAGRAILAPDQANIRELLEHARTAILFDPAAPGSLEAGLDRLVGDAALRREIGRKAREEIERRDLTWDGHARRILMIAGRLTGR